MLGALIPMRLRSWLWRRMHRPDAVGFSRPQVATSGTKLARFVMVGHVIPTNDAVARAFPRRAKR